MDQFLDVNGARLWYEEAGQGLPVVFVHAGIADHRMWDGQFTVFAKKYRAIRYDHRGYGQSAMVAGSYSLRGDLYGVLNTLDVERAVLVGCSIGGMTVIDFALEHPEMSAAQVLVGAGIYGFPYEQYPDPPLVEQIIAADKAGDLDLVNELEVRLWVEGVGRQAPVDPTVRAKVLEMNRIALNTPSGLGEHVLADPPAYGRVKTIQAPTLAIYGDLDLAETHDAAQYLGSQIPNARVACLTGTAHLPNMERPEDFNRLVLGFLDEVGL